MNMSLMNRGSFIPANSPLLLLSPPPPPPHLSIRPPPPAISLRIPSASPSSSADIEMFHNPLDGSFSSHQPRAVILWDLDNKPPRGAPYPAALSLRRLASLFGRLDSFSAYANRHAFLHLPPWVLHNRRNRRHQDLLERKGLSLPSSPYPCRVCGRKFPTNLDLKKHFKQLHERERQKKLSRLRSLKGKKKRQKYKERFISNNVKYEEAARELLTPKRGYGLAAELRRAGVFVKTVEDKPQAADAALKRQMMHWMGSGIDWVILVSDDSDFKEMVGKAREAELGTVVVGDGRRALGRHADLWVPWGRVESGELGREEVMRWRRGDDVGYEDEEGEGSFLSERFYESRDVYDDEFGGIADEIVSSSSGNKGTFAGRMSAFSEEEDLVFGSALTTGIDLVYDSEDDEEDEEEEEDFYI